MATVGGIKDSGGSSAISLEIDELAKFAVDHYNSIENALLEFPRVVNTKEQVVAGTIYYITLEATDGGVKKLYEANVWVKPGVNFKEVQVFKYVGDAFG
uniref:Cysteine proteinase inhibitor n=1 Tax=Dianthus caryophyllus TaxID=3570 RepID=Q9ZTB4_DIACA|nr:cysteine proteinase inhibitor [Dianthus caryophyllus]